MEQRKQPPIAYLIIHRSPVFILLTLLAVEVVYLALVSLITLLGSTTFAQSSILPAAAVITAVSLGVAAKLLAKHKKLPHTMTQQGRVNVCSNHW